MTDFERIVIVGAGVAGLRAAERLRELDYDGELVIIGDEPRWPYHRPLVSKDLLAGSDRPADLTLQRHVDTGARWRLGTRAERLETTRKVVHLPGGEEIKYDGLIIATGVEPRHLKGVPRHSPRVHTLRTVDEAMAAKRTIAESDLPIVVLGTGYIGCDVAASARKMGRDVTMVGRSRFPLRNLGNDVASAVDNLHRKHRARMAMGTDIRNWIVSDDSIAMHTTDGQLLVAGCVIMAVGSIPAVEWMRGSGLVLEDGVLCESTLFAAGAQDVVVAGDCARWPNLRFDETPRRIEHWINAVEMGRAAAENLLVGREKASPFMPIPRVWSGQYGVRLQIAGIPSLGKDTVHLSDGAPGTPGVTGYVRNGKLVGVCGWDTPRAMIKWTEELHNLLPVPSQGKRPVAPAPAAKARTAETVAERPPAPPARQNSDAHRIPVMAQASAMETTHASGAFARASAEIPAPARTMPVPAVSMQMAVPQMAGPAGPRMSVPQMSGPQMSGRHMPVPQPSGQMSAPGPQMSQPMARPPAPARPPVGPAGPGPRGPVPPAGRDMPSRPGPMAGPPSRPGVPPARPPMHSMPMARPDVEPMTAPVPVVRAEPIRSEPMLPPTTAIPNLSAPNLSLSNLSVPKIPVPDTPATAMRPAPPPARQRRSNDLPPMPPPLPNQHPSFPTMRPVARPPADAPLMEHPSFPSMRPVQRPPAPLMEHPSFPSMQPVRRPDPEDVRLPAGEVIRGFG